MANMETEAIRRFRRVVVRYCVEGGMATIELLGRLVDVPEAHIGGYMRKWALQRHVSPIMMKVDPERLKG